MNLADIYKQAIEKNLCKEWQESMKNDLSLANLCKMYFDGDDWAMEKDFPNIETLRNFKGKTEVYGLFTDYIGMPNILSSMAFFGKSEVKLSYTGFSVSQLILRHETKAKIYINENAILILNLLDSSEVEIESIGNSKVEIFNYGKGEIKAFGDVRIHNSSFK